METNNEVKIVKYHFKSIPGNAQLNIYYDPETANEDYFVNAVNNYDKLKEDNERLLEALKLYLEIEKDKYGFMPVFLRPATSKAKEAVQKAENK